MPGVVLALCALISQANLADMLEATVLRSAAQHRVPGVSVAVIRNGRFVLARGYGVLKSGEDRKVDSATLFQAASISKPVTAMAALHMAQEGRFSLDEDISPLLRGWKLPPNDLTRSNKVTVRRILSHTAGITVSGFPGYPAGAPVPTLVQILDGLPPANTAPIRVDAEPGSLYRYSGGGYTLLGLLMAEKEGFPLRT